MALNKHFALQQSKHILKTNFSTLCPQTMLQNYYGFLQDFMWRGDTHTNNSLPYCTHLIKVFKYPSKHLKIHTHSHNHLRKLCTRYIYIRFFFYKCSNFCVRTCILIKLTSKTSTFFYSTHTC